MDAQYTNNNQTVVVANDHKSHTLQQLFNVICADNEFTLLRHTLALYCEEIEKASAKESIQ
ncbi:MAG: hypothetical protein ACK5Y6_06015 [Pseudomonadota bacterium]|jgi:hypothetical protein